MHRFKFFVLTLISLFTFSALAGPWGDELERHFANYYHPLENTFVSTVQSSCRARAPRYWQMVTDIKEYRVSSSFLASNELPFRMGLQKNENDEYKKAPLVFIIPGAFGNLKGNMPRQLSDAFSRLGYHTVAFPNPWGTDYIKQKPLSPTGSVLSEGQSLYEGMRKIHQSLKQKGLLDREVKVYGVSYGGFLSVMINALDAESRDPIITGEVTAVSPPFALDETLDQLDSLVSETQPFIGIGLFDIIKRGLSLCLLDSNSSVDSSKIKNAKGLAIGAGFHAGLINSLRAYDKVWGLRSVPHSFWGSYSPVFRRWMRSMSFTRYYKTYAPKAYDEIHSEIGQLYSWQEKAQRYGAYNTRIVSTEDDFLNNNERWPAEVYNEETVMLPNGGHYGFKTLYWYKQFQKKALFQRP